MITVIGSYFVPAGCDILIPLAQLHRWPDLWPNPSKFDPDRFLPEEIKNRPRGAYLPFSTGPRNCIGKSFFFVENRLSFFYRLEICYAVYEGFLGCHFEAF